MLVTQLRIRCFIPLRARWKIVQGSDSKRDGRALSAPLGDPSEVFRYLGSGIVVTADDGAEETAEVGVGFDAQAPQRAARRLQSTGSRRKPEGPLLHVVAP